jgi:hypothetical protein
MASAALPGTGRKARPTRKSTILSLIAAAFCMFNRYVDGLATWQPSDPEIYREIGMLTAQLGYVGRDYTKPLRAIAAKLDKVEV